VNGSPGLGPGFPRSFNRVDLLVAYTQQRSAVPRATPASSVRHAELVRGQELLNADVTVEDCRFPPMWIAFLHRGVRRVHYSFSNTPRRGLTTRDKRLSSKATYPTVGRLLSNGPQFHRDGFDSRPAESFRG